MAIVKFISEIDCNVYIDMELAGELQAGKMLKLPIDVGSYLVEAKDADGNTIKKYELKISPVESQILQNITEDSIDDILGKLKNDSSLCFYNQRAVFNHNGFYGYINSLYNIVIQPIYSYAGNFTANKAFVRRIFPDGEKGTIIDVDGNILLSQWYDYIGGNEKSVLLKNKKMYYVLSIETCSVLQEYWDAGYNGNSELIPISREFGIDVFYGYINTSGEEIIPLIYDYVWNFDDKGFAKVKRFGSNYVVNKDGTLYHNMEDAVKDGKKITRARNIYDEPGDGDIEEVFKAVKLTKEESIRKGFNSNFGDDGYWEEYPIKEGECWGLGGFEMVGDDYSWINEATNRIDKYHCDRIIYYTDGYFVYRKDGICKLLNIMDSQKEYPFNADEIIPIIQWRHTDNGYYDTKTIINLIIKRNKKYGIISLKGKTILPIEYDLIITSDSMVGDISGNIGIVWKGEKCALVRMNDGYIYEPFKYEDIIVNESDCKEWQMNSTYLVRENGKYGCINFEGYEILPSIYDSIECKLEVDGHGYHYMMFLYKDGKVGTYEYCNYRSFAVGDHEISLSFTVEPDYDECVFLKNRGAVNSFIGMYFIAVRKGKQWGILDNSPASATYYPADETYWRDSPNLKDLEFKYDSLEELKINADAEFRRRYKKYERPHIVIQMGDSLVVSEIEEE